MTLPTRQLFTTLRRPLGMTLIELMVALAIGAFLMIGAITVFMQSRTTFRITESLARLQENGRFAIEAMEPDIRMAHYWGLTPRTFLIRPGDRPGPLAPAGIGPHTCGNNWVVNLDQTVGGTNNGYAWACAPLAPVEGNSDTLVVRRASEDPAPLPLTAGTRYLQTTRSSEGRIFVGTTIPAGYNPAVSATHRLIVNGYYVSRSSTVGATPSLRVKTLLANGTIQDQEVIAGVEDMQIQFGIDTDPPGTPTAPNLERGSIDRYVNVDDPLVEPFNPNSDVEILAVRVWLRIRAERPEQGFTDTVNYVYADQNVGPFNDNFRRIVVSKTIYLRNARPAS